MARALPLFSIALAVLLATPSMVTAKAPDTWDNLIKVKSTKLEAVYLLPNADFRSYTKVMIDPTQVAFQKDWQSTINDQAVGLSGRINDTDANAIAAKARTGFESIVAKAFSDAGYQVVTTAGPGVLRLSTAVLNLYINAPDPDDDNVGNSYTAEAGQATVVIEARDSQTGAVLGRAIDEKIAGDYPSQRTSMTNRDDFSDLFKTWAKTSVNGLGELKAMSPINTEGQPSSR